MDLAAKLGYSVDATFRLLSKSINLKKVEGYITSDGKKYVSKEYVQKQLTTHLNSYGKLWLIGRFYKGFDRVIILAKTWWHNLIQITVMEWRFK